MFGIKLIIISVLASLSHSHVKEKIDLDSMTGDEIAAMALEAKQNNSEEQIGPSLNYAFGGGGPDPFEGMDLPDEIRQEIEKAVHDTMKKILLKAKDSKALRKVIRDELRGQPVKEGMELNKLYGDFGWDINAEEQDDEDTEEEFNENKYFEDELEGTDNQDARERSGKENEESSRNEDEMSEKQAKDKTNDEL